MEAKNIPERHTFRDVSIMAEEARRRAEIARLVLFLKLDVDHKAIVFKFQKKMISTILLPDIYLQTVTLYNIILAIQIH